MKTTVGFLRVLLLNDDGSWFAQGLEIGYAAQGKSLADVTARFEEGLFETNQAHLQQHGDFADLVEPAPALVWRRFMTRACRADFLFEVSTQERAAIGSFPFAGLSYFQEVPVGANRARSPREIHLDGEVDAGRRAERPANTGIVLDALLKRNVQVTIREDRQVLERGTVLEVHRLPSLLNAHMVEYLSRRFGVDLRDNAPALGADGD